MTFYSDMRNVALSILAEFGQPGTLRSSSSVYSPSTGESVQTDTDTVVTLALLPLPRGRDEYAPSLVQMSTNAIIMSANELATAGVRPSANDKILIGSKVYDITHLTAIEPAGTVVAYKMLVAN